MLTFLIASIPSPPGKSIGIDPVQLRAYGLAIAVGVLVAVWIAQRRYARRGGDPEALATIAMWAVPMGLVGARLYHVVTDYQRFQGRWWSVVEVWEGGLGIPGGLLAGVITGVVLARRRGLDVPTLLDVAAPAIPIAQAIGRLGNWFNQELFGRPSDLPWAVRIDPAHRPDGLEHVATYHPTFLYEALWNVALAALLIRLDRTGRLRRGQLFTLYVAGYALGRLWVEALRIDSANEVLGLRVNIWMSFAALAIAAAVFAVQSRHADPMPAPEQGATQR
ncbi:prolipoprotein diacylglyceryl transferase [Actinomarinicola tropica]|uniref:Phosphatidylglycerol--prolipoprotein diacylglyceryl transferase n=1 Tax=Actinomarinicola tropica TaxID=2789776 RepID=A0A5Q2RHF5_9ACTN|nr:prolipoprotein diacylglyceryl transferase [Actinomarinicola tropica]QGG96278.1 prolipoprotein diacylglyceryl transferase [Actinomarinicola tropica]